MSCYEGIIYFRNLPFVARTPKKGGEVKCTPVVFGSGDESGIRVFYSDGDTDTLSVMAPRNLVAVWRGTEFLRHCSYVDRWIIRAAYYAGCGKKVNSMPSKIISAMVGKEVHADIMKKMVPVQIIQATIEGYGNETPTLKDPLILELKEGRIPGFIYDGSPADKDRWAINIAKEMIAKNKRGGARCLDYFQDKSQKRGCPTRHT